MTPSSGLAASPEGLQQQFQVLREAYIARLTEKLAQIEREWQAALAEKSSQQVRHEHIVNLHRLTHSLAGSGATFGFPLISQHARSAEIILKSIVFGETGLGHEEKVALEAAYAELKQASQELSSPEETIDLSSITPVDGRADGPHLVYLLTDDDVEVRSWIAPLHAFGYQLCIFEQATDLLAAVQKEEPSALILDCHVEPLHVIHAGKPLSATLHEMSTTIERPFPILWTCNHSDLRSRLQAVRLGGNAFFSYPVDIDSLLSKLDALTSHQAPEPFRVLIVDDEPALARLLSLMLRQAGMETREVTDPFAVMAPLVDFRPDLILMDVYMPGCNGTELAAVIRQQEAYVGIPIVFLSVETDVARQLDAMRQGGDDFLIKPVEPRHLVSAVSTRATRARVLRNLMVRDSLTGLLNHTKTKEQLDIELSRTKRSGNPLCLAMIDIDHFKSVNDTYGHATGDRVLRSLSRLLTQRLRKTDVIGRYGGEEFAVIMSGAGETEALRVLEEVRETFANIAHYADGHNIHITFSAGLACSTEFSDAAEISEAADQALYKAKHAGRNCITVRHKADMDD